MRYGLNSLPDSYLAESPWYAIYTRHQHEKMVVRALTGKGFETFLPLHTADHRWKDRTKILSLPLFPCYVFFRGTLEHSQLQVIATPGVYAIVSSGGQPAAIPSIEIETIRRIVESGARVESHPFLTRGNRVRIKCGPFVGIQGILVRKKNKCRLVLSVEMLGKAVAVEVDAVLVEKVIGKRPNIFSPGPRIASVDSMLSVCIPTA
jgi:transcription antitermination factor NusG